MVRNVAVRGLPSQDGKQTPDSIAVYMDSTNVIIDLILNKKIFSLKVLLSEYLFSTPVIQVKEHRLITFPTCPRLTHNKSNLSNTMCL